MLVLAQLEGGLTLKAWGHTQTLRSPRRCVSACSQEKSFFADKAVGAT